MILKIRYPVDFKTATGKKWAAALKQGGEAGYGAFVQLTAEFADGKPSVPRDVLERFTREAWLGEVAAAEHNNKPRVFTAFSGFEWTQSIMR